MKNNSVSGSFSFGVPVVYAPVPGFDNIAINDLDGDGEPDLVAANASNNYLAVIRYNSSAGILSFAAPVNLPALLYPMTVTVGDLDGDHKPDILSAGLNPINAISVWHAKSKRMSAAFVGYRHYSPLKKSIKQF